MDRSPPDDDALRLQAAREVQALRHLKALDEQAQALKTSEADRIRDQAARMETRQQKDREAEEARKQEAERRAAEDRKAKEGDISNPEARYAIALGENYNARDPYVSLARAAMSESAMFHRGQEQMRAEMAKEPDPAKREIIELRRQIEGCDYMAITSDRLAGISTAITGRTHLGKELGSGTGRGDQGAKGERQGDAERQFTGQPSQPRDSAWNTQTKLHGCRFPQNKIKS